MYHDQYVSSHDEKEQLLEQRYHYSIFKNLWQSRGHLIQGAWGGIILDLSRKIW